MDAPGATATITGQTVTVVILQLDPGASYPFSIFTTVLSGVEISNTACVLSYDDCATGLVARTLPGTGETLER